MRNYFYIVVVILAYLLLSSKSCDSDKKESSISYEAGLARAKEVVKNEFESDEISGKSLNAFEVKAKQKLVDFSDYLNIYSVKRMDESFRNQAHQMILDLFISDSVQINTLLSNNQDEKNIPIGEFLHRTLKYNSMNFIFDSLEITRPLCKTDELNYMGSLRFSRRLKTCTSADTLIIAPAEMEVEIFVSKIRKAFGYDTLQIWKVSLGNIH